MNQSKSASRTQPKQMESKQGDYLLARAKRTLERYLRSDGYSKSEALRLIHDHFNHCDSKGNAK